MKKQIVALGLVAVMAMTPSSYSLGDKMNNLVTEVKSEIKIKNKKLTGKSTEIMRMEVDVNIPIITGTGNSQLEYRVNSRIERDMKEHIDKFIQDSENAYTDGDYKLDINYEVKSKEGILSIVFEKDWYIPGVLGVQSEVYFYNIDLETGAFINLKDVFRDGVSYEDEINSLINDKINKNPDDFYMNEMRFEGIEDSQKFYMNNEGDIIVVFLEEEIAPRKKGIQKFNTSEANLFNMIKEKFIREEDIEIEVSNFEKKVKSDDEIIINIPQFSGFPNIDFEEKLNNSIKLDMEKALEEFQEKAKNIKGKEESELSISYEIKSLEDILSFVVNRYELYAGNSNGQTTKKFYNIDLRTYEELELQDMFKHMSNHKAIISDLIRTKIEEDKDSFFQGEDGFKRIKDDQNFFIDEYGNIIIEFAQYEIAPGSTGTPQFKLSSFELRDILKEEMLDLGLKHLDRIIINGDEIYLYDDMYISTQGNIMIPLYVLEKEFNLGIEWDEKTRIANINNAGQKSGLSLDKNYYFLGKATVILSQKAESVDGKTYVPKDFIDNILKYKTSLDKNGVLNIER